MMLPVIQSTNSLELRLFDLRVFDLHTSATAFRNVSLRNIAIVIFCVSMTGLGFAQEKTSQETATQQNDAKGKPDSPEIAKLKRQGLELFERRIRPLLIEHCYECHSAESGESEGGLLLDSATAMRRGGNLGPTLVPGAPEQSILIHAVRYNRRELQMPPTDKLSDDDIQALEKWIALGAMDPRKEKAPDDGDESIVASQADPSSHWAFQLPTYVSKSDRDEITGDDRDVVDSVVATVARSKKILIAELATDDVLIRRLAFDLTGVPPTAEQIEEFVNSGAIDKYERLVDTYLASPDFAERFARHWMDVARYADTVGYALAGKERRLKGSELYRDWLVNSFAKDLPYDQMVRYQLAGDRHDPENESGNLHAMGFLTVGRRFLNKLDTTDDQIDVISRGLLGMTVSCARCHDHKFDPIPTLDYYSLFGVLQSSQRKADGPSPLMMVDKKEPKDSIVYVRGQPYNRGPVAPRQFLTALRKPDEPKFSDGSGRVELAERIVSPDNPLTARVFVNRIWGHLIGRPLVDTPSDFGVRTEQPELVGVLDELAISFSQDWSVKRLVRRIVTSRIYRQSASVSGETLESDPDNLLLARANRKRRDFESLRDSLLKVAGHLDRSLGGEPVEITLPTPSPRRTLYAKIDRQNLPSLFRTFDFASPDAHTPKRFFTTVPQQALFLLNADQVASLAQSTAERVRRQTGHDDNEQLVQRLFEVILSRRPSENELGLCVGFLDKEVRPAAAEYRSNRAWQYGTSTTDDEVRATEFRPFKVFKDSKWQASEKFPADGPMGYAYLGSENGHPASKHAVVRRWAAPATGIVRIRGLMGHRSDQGDGIRAAIWVGENRIFLETQKSNNRPYGPFQARIQSGEYIELVAAPGETSSFDSFFWRTQISMVADDGRVFEAGSKQDFSGPVKSESAKTLDRIAQLAQALMLSNEFAFVD